MKATWRRSSLVGPRGPSPDDQGPAERQTLRVGLNVHSHSPARKDRNMSDKQPNIVFFYWDNFGWGELGCYGGGILRGAPTPRIDGLAAEGLKLLNFNMEAQCTPARSALLTGRHPIRSGTAAVPLGGWPRRVDTLGGDDRPGAVRCRVRDGDVGQVAPGQRPREPEPGRLRLRRGRLVPAHRRRGPVDDAVVLPERGRDLRAVCRRHEDPGRAADDLSRGRRARSPRRSASTTRS